jgi:hypothetical protein
MIYKALAIKKLVRIVLGRKAGMRFAMLLYTFAFFISA